jgi:hypothetical protein
MLLTLAVCRCIGSSSKITGSYQGVRQQASGATGICGQAWAESPLVLLIPLINHIKLHLAASERRLSSPGVLAPVSARSGRAAFQALPVGPSPPLASAGQQLCRSARDRREDRRLRDSGCKLSIYNNSISLLLSHIIALHLPSSHIQQQRLAALKLPAPLHWEYTHVADPFPCCRIGPETPTTPVDAFCTPTSNHLCTLWDQPARWRRLETALHSKTLLLRLLTLLTFPPSTSLGLSVCYCFLALRGVQCQSK